MNEVQPAPGDDKKSALDNGEPIDEAAISIEAAKAHLRHWWREPLAGLIALCLGAFDTWHFGREGGLTASLDEALVVGGVVLIAGSRRLFSPMPGVNGNKK
jgi:hypothetical protein